MYKELDDNEILYMIQENNDYCEFIFDKYKPYIFNICKKYQKYGKQIGYEMEDLIQVANMGLYDAIKSYKAEYNVLFYTYLIHCVENKLKTEIRNNMTNKKILLNHALSYDVALPGTNITLIEKIPDRNIISPLDYLIIEQKQIEYINFLNTLPFEMAVAFELKNSGFSYSEIANFLEVEQEEIRKYLIYARNKINAYV